MTNLCNIKLSAQKRIRQLVQHTKDPLYRNSLFLMANTAVTVVLGYVFWIIVARYYSEADVGYGNAVIMAISLISLFSRLGLDVALIRFLPKAEKPAEMVNSCFVLSSLVSLALAVIFIAAVDVLSPELGFLNDNAMFALVFMVFSVFWTLSWMLDQVFIARRRAGFVFYKNTIFSVLKLILPFIMMNFFYAFGIVSSWGIAVGISSILALLLFAPRVLRQYRVKPKIEIGIIKRMWSYSFKNYVVILFSTSPTYLLPLLIINRLGPEQNAYFYIAWMVATALYIIPTAVSQSLFAEGSHFEDKLDENVHRSFKFMFILLIPAVVVMLIISTWILLAFGASYAENATLLLSILAVSGIFVGINRIYSIILLIKHRIGELIIITCLPTVAFLAACYFITPVTGIEGVGYAWLGVELLVSLYVLAAMKKLKIS